MEAVWITILTIGSQIKTMCTIGCAFYAEVDRPSVIDALDDIFLKFKKNSYSYPMTYMFGTQKKQNTSFQKRERGFYVFGNSYFGSPIRNGLKFY